MNFLLFYQTCYDEAIEKSKGAPDGRNRKFYNLLLSDDPVESLARDIHQSVVFLKKTSHWDHALHLLGFG